MKAAVPALRSKFRALVVLATGLGKTLTAALIAKEMRSKRILFLVHNNFILKHAFDEFCRVFDTSETKMAIYNGMTKNGASDADIVFASWQTMGSNLTQWAKDRFDLVIVDEAHHTEADTYRPVADYFTGCKLGITATPNRADQADIRVVFGKEVIEITLEEAIARGWLPKIEYHVITDESLDEDELQKIAAEIREGKKRFTMAEVNRRIFIKKRDREITKIINGYDEKAIVFCSSIAHASRLKRTLKKAATFHSQKAGTQKETWNQNQRVLHNLRDGVIRRVCAVNAFNEGVDVPSVGLVAFCRVTGVDSVFRQQLGRGLRPGKDKLVVLDFVGNLERIQLLLRMMKRIADLHDQYTPAEEKKREGYSRQVFEVSGNGFEFTFSDTVVDLMKVLEHCERQFYPTWKEASEAIRRLGITSWSQYRKKFSKDERLPYNPDRVYPDFPGIHEFVGKEKTSHYPTWQEASAATIALGITTPKQYKKRRTEDPRLPSHPEETYGDFPSFSEFFGRPKREVYATIDDAAVAAKKLGCKNWIEYKRRYKEDPKLVREPWVKYGGRIYPNWVWKK